MLKLQVLEKITLDKLDDSDNYGEKESLYDIISVNVLAVCKEKNKCRGEDDET